MKIRSRALIASLVAVVGAAGLTAPGQARPAMPTPGAAPALLEVGAAVAADGLSVRASRAVEVDADLLRAGRPQTVSLDLFSTTRVVDLEPSVSGAAGWAAWSGAVVGDDASSVSLIRRGDDVTGLISTSTGSYRIRTVGPGEQVTELIGTFPEGPDTVAIPGASDGGDHHQDHGGLPAGDGPPAAAADDPPVIDVLVAYTPAALAAAGSLSAVQAEAALSIATTNNAYAASGVVGSVRLAGLHALTTNLALSSAALDQLTFTDGVDDAVHAARNAVSADLVSALVVDGSACGLAWVRNALGTSNAAYGFSLVDYSCGVSNLSFPHELGHNMGLNHDRYVSTPGGELFPYAYGHVNTTGRWRTIMAYNNLCSASGFNCTRLGRFSNPDQTHNGAPLGVAVGAANAADNRQALNASLPSLQNYRVANRAPVANAQSVAVVHRVAKAITLTGSDPDGSALSYAVVGTPTKGTLSGSAPNLTYTPASGQVGSDAFTFRVSDGTLTSSPATVSISITNTVPVASSASVSAAYETAKAITRAGTDADGNSLTYGIVTPPTHGFLSNVTTGPNLTYNPDPGWSGPDSFTFIVSDGHSTATATISITVGAKPNTAPVAANQSVSVTHRRAKGITLSGTDADGTPLTYVVSSSPTKGTLSGTAPDLTYTPASGQVGSDSFTFTVSDGSLNSTGTVSITITNTAPVATNAAVTTAYETARAITLAGTDADGNSLTYGIVSPPSHGSIVGSGIGPNVTYTPATGWSGPDSFTFIVSDGHSTATGTVSITTARAWWAPWSSASAAVDDLYRWFTGVAPTPAERTAALSSLNAGSTTTGDLVAALRGGADATTKVDPAARLYAAYFVRIPDAGGLTYWIGKRRAGATLAGISSSFAASSEFKNRYGSLGNRAFVELVYQNVLGRPGDAGGIASWTGKLDRKALNRGQVMVGFSESNEYQVGQVEEVHAAVIYVHLVGRAPSTAERDAFVALLEQPTVLGRIVDALIALPAVAARAG